MRPRPRTTGPKGMPAGALQQHLPKSFHFSRKARNLDFSGNHLSLKCWLNLKIEATLGVLKVLILTEGIYELFICILQMRRQRLCNSPTARMPDQDTYPNSLAPEPVLFSTAPICCLDLAHGPVVCDLWQVSERRRGPGAEPWP